MVAVVVLVAVAGLVVYLLARRPSEPADVSPQQARVAADATCAAMTTFEDLVRRNARVDEVREVLERAEKQADRAARGDAVFLGLSGGVKSVRIALDGNDGRAARVGIGVVRAECDRLAG